MDVRVGLWETVAKARDLDAKRRALIGETETLKQQRNSASKEIGAAAKAGQDISAAKEKVRAIGDRIAEIDRELAQVEVDLRETLLMIPNIPAPEIPTGLDSSSNKVVRHVGKCSYQNKTENTGLTTFGFSIRGIQGKDWNVEAASSLLIAHGGLRVSTELVKVCGP